MPATYSHSDCRTDVNILDSAAHKHASSPVRHTHTLTHTSHTCTQAFSRPWLNLPCFHLWENLNPPKGGAPSYFCERKKKDPDGDDDNIADLKIRWNENNMLNMRKSTTLPFAPFRTDSFGFVCFFVKLACQSTETCPLEKQKGIWGWTKISCVWRKTLRNCGLLTMLTITSTPTSRLWVASIELLHTGTNRTRTCPLFKDQVLRHLCFLITVFFRFVLLNGSRLECNKKETILNVLWHFIAKKWKILFLSVFCVHPCK